MTQQRVIYWLQGAPPGHPQSVMKQLAETLGFKVIDATPQSITDQWWFWIEYDAEPALPDFIQTTTWKQIGSA